MRRISALAALCAALAAGLGCQHIGGKCDCGASPNDGVPNPIVTPYPAAPAVKAVPVIPKGGNED